ncbi:40S ribosomal eS8 domain-containing protein [Aspergillus ibericus CBS 121593]|uniref:40S ribosomal protein S8 n=1 Tax=Aspergillus ibericus CBS 121593 TaxID=1448316 RepID=A0A395GXR0_9EURO|nr:hypothetical protein BO80DRAFT_455645 [Aspergillus ibericus CBS 121593]RAL00402.1 hypothetical protein BO80DRAFT_455645 [Aspergillus ibericus CBS 121593]
MGISRDSRHKRSATGAKRATYRKKRAFEKGRQPSNTRIGAKRIHLVRTRGGNQKFRALRLDSGNFSWGSEGVSRKTRVIVVAYHPSNNELVRTNTLTKSAVVQIDAAPFRQWYEAHYGQPIGRRRQQKTETTEEKKSNSVVKKQAARFADHGKVESAVERQFESGRLYAVVSSRPGQSGRVDGYILEGEELAFYQRAIRNIQTKMKTTLLLLSDTHTLPPHPPLTTSNAYRHPLPPSDILIHAGDLTKVGYKHEHQTILQTILSHPAPLKLIIPGNHDITLDEPYYTHLGHYRHKYRTDHTAPSATSGSENVSAGKAEAGRLENLDEIRELYTGSEAREKGIRYLEEGMYRFRLGDGRVFSVYASPYTPEFCQWAFAYERGVDRFNPVVAGEGEGYPVGDGGPLHPVPDYPGVDIMITHGPPYGILDQVVPGHMSVGCEHLFRAVKRARPRLHVFGHIHEGYGAVRKEWSSGNESMIQCDKEEMLEERCARVDVSAEGSNPLRPGAETLFVNASVVTVQYHAINAPWLVELDLPVEKID